MNEWSRRWDEYQRWAEAHCEPDPRSPEAIMLDLETLYWSYPPEVRNTDPDPGKAGIQNLHRAFALYELRRARINTRAGG